VLGQAKKRESMPIQANKKYSFPIVERGIRETNEFVDSEQ